MTKFTLTRPGVLRAGTALALLALAQPGWARSPVADEALALRGDDDRAAGAEDGAPEAGNTIVVTGARAGDTVLPTRPPKSLYGFEEAVVDTPRAVSQITAAQLARDPIRTVDDYVKYAPGITRGGGQSNSPAPIIRGLTSEVFQNGQRIYRDGNDHPLNLNAFESADIVAGAPSEVFGPASGTGGYVNYITKKPYFDRLHADLTAQIGTWVPDNCQRHCKNPRKWQSKIPHFRFWAVRWLVASLHFWVDARGGVVRSVRAV